MESQFLPSNMKITDTSAGLTPPCDYKNTNCTEYNPKCCSTRLTNDPCDDLPGCGSGYLSTHKIDYMLWFLFLYKYFLLSKLPYYMF